jgi:dihydrodipicolinate synthase/N-acetylneuraminate lyase
MTTACADWSTSTSMPGRTVWVLRWVSELPKLTEAERNHVLRLVVDQVRGRVPVVVNTRTQANLTAVLASQDAEARGAQAVMCVPPATGCSASKIRSYFKAISDAVTVPMFVQDTLQVPVSGALIRQIADESERVRCAKVESPPQPRKVQEAVEHTAGLMTIFGAAGGAFLIEELRRGSVGTMPWSSTPHAFVQVWSCWQARDVEQAHVQLNAPARRRPIPDDLWSELKAVHLLREDAPLPRAWRGQRKQRKEKVTCMSPHESHL